VSRWCSAGGWAVGEGYPARWQCPADAWRAARAVGGGGAPPAAPGWGRGRRREDPGLLQRLERPDPHTIGHTASRDGGGFDSLEQFVPGGAVVQGAAHVGLYPILQPA
jgi:hypothetical protein